MNTTKDFSFDLDERIIKALSAEFDPQKAVEQFAAALTDKCGQEEANTLPCQYACLAGCETLKQDLGLTVDIEMEASTPKDGFRQFALNRAS